MTSTSTAAPIMTSAQFLEHWQGHRALTRRAIVAFPDDKLFTYTRRHAPFSGFAKEFLGMAVPTLHGVITGEWKSFETPKVTTKADILRLWDEATAEINTLWPTFPRSAFRKSTTRSVSGR